MQAVSSSCQSASANQRKFFGLDSEPKSRELSENEIKKLKSLDMVVNQPVLLILDHKIVILTTWLPFFTKSDKLNRFLRWKLPYDRSFTIKIERIQEVQNPRKLYLYIFLPNNRSSSFLACVSPFLTVNLQFFCCIWKSSL